MATFASGGAARIPRLFFSLGSAGAGALALAIGCSSSSSPSPPPGEADAGIDSSSALPSCDAVAARERDIAIDPNGPDSQIHAIAAFSAGRVFVAYNRPREGASTFDVYLTALACDGSALFPPVRVNEDQENNVDPSLAVVGETVLVSWAGDATGKDPNLHLRTRAFDLAGAPLGPPRTFAGPRKALQQTKFNIWQGSLAPLGTGFALVGAWGVEEAAAFQVFGARLDPMGAPVGDAFDVAFDAGTTQNLADVASDGSRAWAAWLVEPNTTDGKTVATTSFGATGAPTRGPSIVDAANPTVAVRGDAAWVVAQRGARDVVLQRLDKAGAPKVLTGKGTQPAIALSSAGGAFVSYRESAAARSIAITSFDASGEAGGSTDLGVDDAAPYPFRLVSVADGLYFLAYQHGKSPALRAKGRFIDLRGK